MKEIRLPELALVLLVGPSSSGKSTFARKYFLPTEVISSDYCRALVSDDENNLDATSDAFEVLHFLAAKRLKRGKLTVVDALNIRKEDRARLVQLAKDNYALATAIVFENPIRTLFERHETRTDRNFGKNVLDKQYDDMKRSLRTIEREGFSYVHFVKGAEECTIVRQRLWNDKKHEAGPFDIVGDVHGCYDELVELLGRLGYAVDRSGEGRFNVSHSGNRRLIFVGDLVDRGPDSPDVLRLVMDAVKSGSAFCVPGNHDDKFQKYLEGKNVNIAHGLESTIHQFADVTPEFRNEVKGFIYGLVSHLVLDGGRLVVAHAGLPEAMHGRAAASVRSFCLYGETTGEIDEFGLPVRYNWAKNYRGKATVVFGHTPVPEVEWLNNTVDIDTGCVFGGKLTALRYPEREFVDVKSRKTYFEPIKPFLSPDQVSEEPTSADEDILDIAIVSGKYIVETGLDTKVIIREENGIAALEAMSRFAVSPNWLIYLPPTMSPPETSRLQEYLEHPAEVFEYFRRNGIPQVICQEKHMGSRCIAIVCKTPDVAVKRFGLIQPADGIMYTRTGRRFFDDAGVETQFLSVLNAALTESGFWKEFDTEWVCLDGELMPWSAKAKDLLTNQYAAVGASASNAFTRLNSLLNDAQNRGVDVAALNDHYAERAATIDKYIQAYRNYCNDVNGIEGLTYAPFHLLATEGRTHFDRPNTWHMETLRGVCGADNRYLRVTETVVVDLQNQESENAAIDWWVAMTTKGGEGMVVKPFDFIPRNKGRLIQPAMKCRGSEYLRIIYGPEYDVGGNLLTLKERNVKVKRNLALQEFALGVESLSRFVRREPLHRVHECSFGVLALESESVDPRL